MSSQFSVPEWSAEPSPPASPTSATRPHRHPRPRRDACAHRHRRHGQPAVRAWQQASPASPWRRSPRRRRRREVIVNATSGAPRLRRSTRPARTIWRARSSSTSPTRSTSPRACRRSCRSRTPTASASRSSAPIPSARVVKTLNTMNASVMVEPARVAGHHTVFVAGDDTAAKATVAALLESSAGPASSSTSATSRPHAAPRCSCRSGCGCGVRSARGLQLPHPGRLSPGEGGGTRCRPSPPSPDPLTGRAGRDRPVPHALAHRPDPLMHPAGE